MRKLACLLLALCFVLPLSTCRAKAEPGSIAQAPDWTLYGYQLAVDALGTIGAGDLTAIAALIAVVLTFFLPLIALAIREPWRSILHLMAAFPAMFFLYAWTFIGKPQFGGLLAIGCWMLLLLLSGSCLWQFWRNRRDKRRMEKMAAQNCM